MYIIIYCCYNFFLPFICIVCLHAISLHAADVKMHPASNVSLKMSLHLALLVISTETTISGTYAYMYVFRLQGDQANKLRM